MRIKPFVSVAVINGNDSNRVSIITRHYSEIHYPQIGCSHKYSAHCNTNIYSRMIINHTDATGAPYRY